jgi:ABC-type hemin transport system ATPase subunit
MRAVTLRSITRSGLALCALSLLGCNGPSQPSAKNALVSVRLPFAALTRIRMHQLVAKLCARHRTAVLLVTHDVDEAVLLADRVVVLRDGRSA